MIKKILLIAFVVFTFSSCKKTENKDVTTEVENTYAKEADFRAQTHKVYNDSAIEFTVLNN